MLISQEHTTIICYKWNLKYHRFGVREMFRYCYYYIFVLVIYIFAIQFDYISVEIFQKKDRESSLLTETIPKLEHFSAFPRDRNVFIEESKSANLRKQEGVSFVGDHRFMWLIAPIRSELLRWKSKRLRGTKCDFTERHTFR